MQRQPVYGLDLVRFAAAISVLFYHLGFKAFAVPSHPLHLRIGGPADLPMWSAASWWGWIGVQIFFVISGLVIAYSSEGATWRSFTRSRVTRLLPAMLISATLIGAVSLVWGAMSSPQVAVLWVKSVTFFPMGPWLAGQFWTLPVEVCFYAIVGTMIFVRAGRHLEILAWVLGTMSAVYWIGLAMTGVTDTFGRLTQLLIFQHGCYFALGILLAVIDRKGVTASRGALALICGFSVWLQVAASAIAERPGYGLQLLNVWPFLVWITVVGLIAASLYWKSYIARAVGNSGPMIRTLGLVTYPLYLIHMHVGGPVLVEALGAGVPDWIALLLAFAASLTVAWIIAVHLEPPLHRAISAGLKRILADHPTPATIGQTDAAILVSATPVRSAGKAP